MIKKIIRSLDCINFNFLIVMLSYSCTVSHHWGKQSKGTQHLSVLFLMTTYESIITLFFLMSIENHILYPEVNGLATSGFYTGD